jgi:hypothetical protein
VYALVFAAVIDKHTTAAAAAAFAHCVRALATHIDDGIDGVTDATANAAGAAAAAAAAAAATVGGGVDGGGGGGVVSAAQQPLSLLAAASSSAALFAHTDAVAATAALCVREIDSLVATLTSLGTSEFVPETVASLTLHAANMTEAPPAASSSSLSSSSSSSSTVIISSTQFPALRRLLLRSLPRSSQVGLITLASIILALITLAFANHFLPFILCFIVPYLTS